MKNFIYIIILFLSAYNLCQAQTVIQFENDEVYHLKNWNSIDNDNSMEMQLAPQQKEKKSIGKAFIYSLLVPGLGEAYVGNTTYTKIFLSLEVVGWGFLLGNYQHVSWLEKDYQNYASKHASVNKNSKDDQYWIDIGKYNNIYEYNEQRRRDRDVDNIYLENKNYYWQWDSNVNRVNYDKKRINAKSLENDDVYYMGAIVLNHLVSAINALRLAKAYNRNVEDGILMMGVKFDHYSNSLSLSLSQNF